MNNNFEEKLKILKQGYITKLKTMLEEFKSIYSQEVLNVNEIYSKVHTISGTCGMYGLSDLSERSTNFELYLKPLKEAPSILNQEDLRIKYSDYLNDLENLLNKEL